MGTFPKRYGDWVVRWRWPVLLASLLVFGGLGSLALKQRYHDPYDIWFARDDPDLVAYRQLVQQYGADDVVIIAFRDPAGIFTNRALGALLDLTERLEAASFVEKVTSITNYQYVRQQVNAESEDELSVDDLIKREELPLSDSVLRERQRMALAEKAVVGNLVSGPEVNGGASTTAAVVTRVRLDQREAATAVVQQLRDVARSIESKYGYKLYLVGSPVIEDAFVTFGWSETAKFLPMLCATVAFLLLVAFRRLAGVVMPLGVFALAIAPALGVMALLGMWLNALTTIMPQVLITVGIAEAIHLVWAFFEFRRHGTPQLEAVSMTVAANFASCLVTSLTTAIGFFSLCTASVVPMQQLGLGTGLGTLFAWILSFTFLPAALAIWPSRPPRPQAAGHSESHGSPGWWDRVLEGLVRMVSRRPWTVVGVMVVFFLGVASFVVQLRIETAYKNMFKPDTPLRQGLAFVETQLGGSVDIEISLDSRHPQGATDPQFLSKVETIQRFLEADPNVSHTMSVVDILKRINEVMHNDDPAYHTVPASREVNAQYLLLYTLSSKSDALKDRLDVDNRWTRLSARVRDLPSSEVQALGNRVRQFIQEHFPEVTANVTGKSILYTALHQKLKDSTVNSFGVAFLWIALLLAVLFRSITVGLLSMLPNVLPIVATFGLMGLFGIPLDPGSALVASVGLGITLDDTVHFFTRYLANEANGRPPQEAVLHAFREVGKPVTYNTLILALGFSVFAFSQFNFIAYFGTLASCIIVLALLADLFLTPAILTLIGRSRGRAPRLAVGRSRVKIASGIALIISTGFLLSGVGWAAPAEERGLSIMTEQDRVNAGYRDESIVYRMTLFNSRGDRSDRLLEVRTLEGGREGDKTLILFKNPPDLKGTALLTHENRMGDDEQWLYLPADRRIKRIASANRASSFVGSEFTYEDLTPRDLAKYTYRYLRDEAVGDIPVWIVESVPRFKDSGYSRSELLVQQSNFQTLQINLYDRQDRLVKIARFEKWSKVDGWWRALTIRMENVQTKKSTVLERLDVKIGNGFSARDFARQALERQ